MMPPRHPGAPNGMCEYKSFDPNTMFLFVCAVLDHFIFPRQMQLYTVVEIHCVDILLPFFKFTTYLTLLFPDPGPSPAQAEAVPAPPVGAPVPPSGRVADN